MVNWIPLPTRISKGTCENARAAIMHLRNIKHLSVQLVQLLRIISPRQVCANGFNPLCEIRFPSPRALLREDISPRSPKNDEIRR